MPADLQTRLLRVLQDGQFYRVGGHVAGQGRCTHHRGHQSESRSRGEAGHFREDLFHRLNVIRLRVPPLRERREDIPLLLNFFLGRAARELDMEVKTLSCGASQYLTGLDWAGNVRELENLCRWLTVMAPGREVVLDDLPLELRPHADAGDTPAAMGFGAESAGANPPEPMPAISGAPAAGSEWDTLLSSWADERLAAGADHLLDEAIPRLERVMIRAALAHTDGHRQEAARLLGWGRNTLTRKIKELSMSGESA